MQVTDPDFADLRDGVRTAGALAQFQTGRRTVLAGGEPARVAGGVVSGDFFAALGVRPALGRAFAAEELRPGAAPAVVVGHASPTARRTTGAWWRACATASPPRRSRARRRRWCARSSGATAPT